MALYLGKQKVAPVISNEKEDLDAELTEQTNLLNDLDNQVDLLGERENKLAQVVDGTITELTASDLAGATKIHEHAFYSHENLVSIEIPKTVVEIDIEAFRWATALRRVTFEAGSQLTEINGSAFKQCRSLGSEIVIPEGVTYIGNYAFESDVNLMHVTFPSTLLTIGSYIFSGVSLHSFTVLAKTPPTLISDFQFGTSALQAIYIPKGTLEAYQNATNWSTYSTKFVELEA